MNNRNNIDWLRLLGIGGWKCDYAKSIDDEYSFYGSKVFGCQYFVNCWARISDLKKGYEASGDWGVAWIECDVSEYTSREYLGKDDAKEIMYAIDHAETNLLNNGVPFTKGYRFSGKNAANKARRNASIRRKLGLRTVEDEQDG